MTANNQITGAAPLGAVGLDWQLGGFASDPPTASMGSSDDQPRRTLNWCKRWRVWAAAAAQPTGAGQHATAARSLLFHFAAALAPPSDEPSDHEHGPEESDDHVPVSAIEPTAGRLRATMNQLLVSEGDRAAAC